MFLTHRVIKDLAGKTDYLLRWSLWLPRQWSVKLHKIVRADSDRCAHDHPWKTFIRVILWGGYTEVCGPDNKEVQLKPWRPWAPWRIYVCGPDFRHRITKLANGKCSWTLAICGPAVKDWGFFTKQGFMQWRKFVDAAIAKRVLWCDDERRV